MKEKNWKDDITNVRTWEIWSELYNNYNMSDEDIKNLPLDCWLISGITQHIIRKHQEEWNPPIIHKVKPCQNGVFKNIDCLESEDEYGFFESKNDVKPSSCIWIKKEYAEKLYLLFNSKEVSQ